MGLPCSRASCAQSMVAAAFEMPYSVLGSSRSDSLIGLLFMPYSEELPVLTKQR